MSLTHLLLLLNSVFATIDLNFAELEYLADHLLPEECRKLVAAAHFKSYNLPNQLGQAEQALPKDETCLQLLLHWNSAEGEGKGETHEVLEHRLRQMGKYELADWLGRTVFHQLGEDLENSLKQGLQEVANETSTTPKNLSEPTLYPIIEYSDPTEWSPFDSICLVLISGLVFVIITLGCYVGCSKISAKCKNKRRPFASVQQYEMVANELSSDSEDRFDVREHTL